MNYFHHNIAFSLEYTCKKMWLKIKKKKEKNSQASSSFFFWPWKFSFKSSPFKFFFNLAKKVSSAPRAMVDTHGVPCIRPRNFPEYFSSQKKSEHLNWKLSKFQKFISRIFSQKTQFYAFFFKLSQAFWDSHPIILSRRKVKRDFYQAVGIRTARLSCAEGNLSLPNIQ